MIPTIRKTSVFQNFNLFSNKVNKVTFSDNEDLRNVRLWGINTYFLGSGNVGSTMTYNPNMGVDRLAIVNNVLKRSFLNLYDIDGNNFVKDMPLIDFATNQNNPFAYNGNDRKIDILDYDTKFFTGQKLDLQNSFVNIIWDGSASIDKLFLPLEFYYTRIDLDKEKTPFDYVANN